MVIFDKNGFSRSNTRAINDLLSHVVGTGRGARLKVPSKFVRELHRHQQMNHSFRWARLQSSALEGTIDVK
jgi:hypothetical protein